MVRAVDRGVLGEPHEEIRVLHVDDDPEFADLTASFLERSETSFAVTTSTDPGRALDRFREGEFDCVVSDHDMPGVTGLELLAEIRAIDPEIPFVLFTGKGSETIASRAISAGVTDYLQKSVGTDQYTVLANRIENAVETYRSQRALAESQERLSRFIDQSPLGTIEFDEEFRIVRVNDAASEILGYEPDELIGGGWTPFVPEDEEWDVAAVERGLSENRGGFQNVNDIVTKDGERRRTAWYNRVVTDDNGDVITIFSQFEDVTEEYERRQQLERHDVLKSTLFGMLPVGVLAEDADREVIRINDRLLDLFGVSAAPEEVVGADCEALATELAGRFAEPDRFVDRIQEVIDQREPVWNEELVLDSGEALERSYRPIELPDGPGHLWVYYDVSERRNRERRLEALNETARELMAAESRAEVAEVGVEAADSVLGLDANAIHLVEPGVGLAPVAWTEKVRELIGSPPTFTEGDSIAWRAYETGDPVSLDDVHGDPDRYNDDTVIRSELCLPLDDHGVLLAGSPTVGTFDRSDEVLGEILATTLVTALDQVDRTERLRERERRLTRQNARLEEFASVVSHDLRNPLNVAEGRLELAAAECDSEHLTAVSSAHDRMAELIDELLTLAREYDAQVERVPVELDSFVRDCWTNVETDPARLDIHTGLTIRADEGRLKRLLENLLRNSAEHGTTRSRSDSHGNSVEHSSTSSRTASGDSVEHGSTSSRTEPGDDGVTVTVGALDDGDGYFVEDDGPGIPPEERGSIFEYGYSTTSDGTGLGLAIVQQCAEVHGWEISVTDGTDGGARFEITGVEIIDG
jgi:PAS domain S-box-containing protein